MAKNSKIKGRRGEIAGRWMVLAIAVVFGAMGCGSDEFGPPGGHGSGTGGGNRHGMGKATSHGEPISLTIYAAASTTNACAEIIALFRNQYPIEINTNYASSGTLAKQIEKGAPADIYLSANDKWMDSIQEDGKTIAREELLTNTLVLVAPRGNPARIMSPEDLKKDAIERIAIADPNSVPAGIYAKQALTRLGLWSVVEPKVVSGPNVRFTLQYVERGEIPVGVVYRTDAMIADRVEAVYTFDAAMHAPIVYPIALLKHAEGNERARRLYDYFRSEEAMKIFKKYGFEQYREKNSPAREKKVSTNRG